MTECFFFSSYKYPLGPLVDGLSFYLDGQYWKSSEHYYQYKKYEFVDAAYAQRIKRIGTAQLAQILGNNTLVSYNRGSWNKIKYGIMYRAQWAKVTQNEIAKRRLLATEDCRLIFYSSDGYWGNSKNGGGSNYLGIILQKIRDKCRRELKLLT